MARVRAKAALRVACVILIGAGCTASRGISTPPPTSADVDRVILDETPNPGDPNQILELTRVTIGPGTRIPPHTHPGPQLGILVSGTLSYRVIEGEAYIRRRAGNRAGPAEILSPGEPTELRTGDSIHEPTGMIHAAANEGEDAVVIYVSSLFPLGKPISSPAP